MQGTLGVTVKPGSAATASGTAQAGKDDLSLEALLGPLAGNGKKGGADDLSLLDSLLGAEGVCGAAATVAALPKGPSRALGPGSAAAGVAADKVAGVVTASAAAVRAGRSPSPALRGPGVTAAGAAPPAKAAPLPMTPPLGPPEPVSAPPEVAANGDRLSPVSIGGTASAAVMPSVPVSDRRPHALSILKDDAALATLLPADAVPQRSRSSTPPLSAVPRPPTPPATLEEARDDVLLRQVIHRLGASGTVNQRLADDEALSRILRPGATAARVSAVGTPPRRSRLPGFRTPPEDDAALAILLAGDDDRIMGYPTTPPTDSRLPAWMLPGEKKPRVAPHLLLSPNPELRKIMNFIIRFDKGKGLLFARLAKGIVLYRQDLFQFLALNFVPRPPSASVNAVLDTFPFDPALRIGRSRWNKQVAEWLAADASMHPP